MAFLFPRIAYAPVRCGPVRHEIAPLFSLFDETLSQLERASRQQARPQFNPKFDLKETKDAYSLEGELPGVSQENLNIEFTDEHTLTIKGRLERYSESGRRPQAAAAVEDAETKGAVTEGAASETSSVKSHQPTVEDEESANASAGNDTWEEVAAPSPAPTKETTAVEPAKTQQPAPEKDQFWISERSVGEFSRSFNFPSRVNQDAVKASLKNGILSIVVPKAAAPQSRRITVE